MNWKAILKSKEFKNGELYLEVSFTSGEQEYVKTYIFDRVPTDEELGIIIHQEQVRLADITTNHEKLQIDTEIIPIDPNVKEEELKQNELESRQAELEYNTAVIYQKEQEEIKQKAEEEKRLAAQPKKCYIRTFIFADGKKEFHSICDKKDYTREDKPNNEMGLLTGAYVRELLKKDKILVTEDSTHLI